MDNNAQLSALSSANRSQKRTFDDTDREEMVDYCHVIKRTRIVTD